MIIQTTTHRWISKRGLFDIFAFNHLIVYMSRQPSNPAWSPLYNLRAILHNTEKHALAYFELSFPLLTLFILCVCTSLRILQTYNKYKVSEVFFRKWHQSHMTSNVAPAARCHGNCVLREPHISSWEWFWTSFWLSSGMYCDMIARISESMYDCTTGQPRQRCKHCKHTMETSFCYIFILNERIWL